MSDGLRSLLPWRYRTPWLQLGLVQCWLADRHLAGPGGLCARGCGRHDAVGLCDCRKCSKPQTTPEGA